MYKKLIFIVGIFVVVLLLIFKTSSASSVNADTIVIADNGAVSLIIGDNIISYTDNRESRTLGLEVKAKEIKLTPERVESVVKIEPSKTDGKKVQVTVTQAPSRLSPVSPKTITPIVKQVDQVVAQGKSGNVVLSVGPAGKDSAGKDQVSINQGSTTATTNLPVQIDSLNHSVSVVSNHGIQENLSVLPKEALQDIVSKGLINADVSQPVQEIPALLVHGQQGRPVTPSPTPSSSPNPSKTVIQVLQNEPVYQISGDKNINLLNVFKFKIPMNVQISAKTGQIQNFTVNLSKLFGR